MAKNNDVGLVQLANGNWSCRIYKKIDGVLFDRAYRVDSRTGEPFKTKTEARRYREYMLGELAKPENRQEKEKAVKFKELWQHFLDQDHIGKARSTVTKYTSVWKNHLNPEFGEKYISGKNAVSVQEINNYLASEYYHTELSYKYVNSFLKLLYLLYGLAYRHDYIDLETLNKFTKDKTVRIAMPQQTAEDEEEESEKDKVYSAVEIETIGKVFEGTDLETAFLLGYTCGLRESEVFGLMWDDIDLQKKTIRVNKQLKMENGCWCLTPVKTLQSNRVIDIPDKLFSYLRTRKRKMREAQERADFSCRANEKVLDMRGKTPVEITGGDFVNRKLNDGLAGKLLTINSFKYYAQKIKKEHNIEFKTHKLRSTHLSYLASHGYPLKMLMDRAGHKKLETTMKFYIQPDETMQAAGLRILDAISVEDPIIDTTDMGEMGKVLIHKSGRIEKIPGHYGEEAS